MSETAALDVAPIRAQFPICAHTTYLASCSVGALAQPVRQAVESFLRDWNVQGPAWEEDWYAAVLEAERLFAQLYRVHESQVVLLPSVTSAVATLASAFHPSALSAFGGRRRVLIPAGEFPTTGHVWGKQPGLEIVPIPAEADDLTPYLDQQTLLVCISHVCYATGRRRELKTISEQAHAVGALVLVDDSQSAGTRPLDAVALGIDFLVASSHKYLLGLPGGGAFLLVREGLIEQLFPTNTGWAAHEDFVRHIEERHGHLRMEVGDQGWNPFSFEPAADAWRFAGGTANIVGAFAARAGLRLLLEVGLEAIAHHIDSLTAVFVAGCTEQGISLKTPSDPQQRGPMVVLRTREADQLATTLAQQRIQVSLRGADGVRVAFHLYNTLADVREVLHALAARRWLVEAPGA